MRVNYMFKDLATYASQRDWSVVTGGAMISLLIDRYYMH